MRLVVWLWVRLMRVLGMEESGEDLTENPGKSGDVIPHSAQGARGGGHSQPALVRAALAVAACCAVGQPPGDQPAVSAVPRDLDTVAAEPLPIDRVDEPLPGLQGGGALPAHDREMWGWVKPPGLRSCAAGGLVAERTTGGQHPGHHTGGALAGGQ